ncbi:LysR substrate-binding domain-containing protein [Microbulbifer sp. MLAF003]|uniref:LysR family transcriptional regulator n=1 Tax=unclassified Microbulbifer TaxID=2619833 RepID=UPI0024ACC78A|nr:LysR family transcriptional regulator [Microbulbifer sp. MLAF003]WHI52861.1 LysR substrate-binding domain-containing protein [Microbulbifer sp. MLAF003]
MDKIRALRYFKRVAELCSFTAVAEEFDVPASSISRRVRDLEHSLGIELLQRSTRQVEVTELGKLYYSMIGEAIRQLEQADELVSQTFEAPSGLVRISCLPSYGEQHLTPLLEQFAQRYPDIVFDLHYSDDLTQLGKDPVDIAIRGGYAPDEHVIAKRLSKNEFSLTASPEYLSSLKQEFPLNKQAIESANALQYRGPKGPIDWHYFNGNYWEPIELTTHLISNNGKALLAAALNHRGMFCVPSWSICEHIDSGELVEVPTEGKVSVSPGGDIGIFLLYERSKYQIPKIKLCVDFIYSNLGKL